MFPGAARPVHACVRYVLVIMLVLTRVNVLQRGQIFFSRLQKFLSTEIYQDGSFQLCKMHRNLGISFRSKEGW